MRSSAVTRRPAAACALALALTAAAPAETPPSTAPASRPAGLAALADFGPPRQDPRREWTVLAYFAADNDLEEHLLEDLREMEQGLGEDGSVEAVVLIDRARDYDASDSDWTDARVYRVRRNAEPKKGLASELLAAPGELNTGDPKVLEAFLAAAMRAFPARRCALVLSNHGGGWPVNCVDEDTGQEGLAGDALTIGETREAIRAALAAAGRKKLDLLVFDECLMGQLDVLLAVSDLTEFAIGAEDIVAAMGFPYHDVLPLFARKGPTRELVAETVKVFTNSFGLAALFMNDYTMFGYDLSRLEAFTRAFDAVLKHIEADLPARWPAVSRAMFFAESYASRSDYRMGRDALASIDLMDFFHRLQAAGAELPEAELQALREALDALVVQRNAGTARRLSHGVSLHAPVRADNLRPEYLQTPLPRQTAWGRVLTRLHELGGREQAAPKVGPIEFVDPAGKALPALTPLGSDQARFVVDGQNLLSTTLYLCDKGRVAMEGTYVVLFKGFVVDQQYYLRRRKAAADQFDALMPQYVDGRNVLGREMSGLRFCVLNGKDDKAYPVMVENTEPGAMEISDVPALYAHPSVGPKPIPVRISFDVRTLRSAAVSARLLKPDGSIVLRLIEPAPDAKITPRFEVIAPDGKVEWTAGAETFQYAKGLALVPGLMEPGQYALGVEAETIGGRSAIAFRPFELKADPGVDSLVRRSLPLGAKELTGEWELHGQVQDADGGNVRYEPLGLRLAFEPDKKEPRQLNFILHRADGGSVKGCAVPQAGLLPCVVFYSDIADSDELAEALLETLRNLLDVRAQKVGYFLTFLVAERNKPVIYSKDLVAGGVWQWRKVKGAMDIVPHNPLLGLWRAGVMQILFTDEQYLVQAPQGVLDEGTYVVKGNQVHSTSRTGKQDVLTFAVRDNMLVLTDQLGQASMYQRAATLEELERNK